jgi:hypothetical protein
MTITQEIRARLAKAGKSPLLIETMMQHHRQVDQMALQILNEKKAAIKKPA